MLPKPGSIAENPCTAPQAWWLRSAISAGPYLELRFVVERFAGDPFAAGRFAAGCFDAACVAGFAVARRVAPVDRFAAELEATGRRPFEPCLAATGGRKGFARGSSFGGGGMRRRVVRLPSAFMTGPIIRLKGTKRG